MGPFIDISDVDKGYKSLHGDGEFRRFALCRRLPTHYRSKREYGQPLLQMSAAMVGSEARTAAMVDSKARIEALLAPSPNYTQEDLCNMSVRLLALQANAGQEASIHL